MKCLHVNKTATSDQEKMEICCIIENLASIKTRIHRKMIEGLHDIFRFFCFTLGKNLSLSNRDTSIFESPAEPPEISCTFSYTQHGVVLTEISGCGSAALICDFFAYGKCWFYHDMAQMITSKVLFWLISQQRQRTIN